MFIRFILRYLGFFECSYKWHLVKFHFNCVCWYLEKLNCYVLTLCLPTLLNSLINFNSVYGNWLSFYVCSHVKVFCVYSLQIMTVFIPFNLYTSFSCLVVVVRIFNMVFNRSDNSTYPYLILDPREKIFNLLLLRIIFALCCL